MYGTSILCYITLIFGNTTPMEQGEGLRGQNFHDGNSMKCPELQNSHFLFLHPHRGFWPISLNNFWWKLHEIPKTPQKFNVFKPPFYREGYRAIPLKTNVWWELHELYRAAWNSFSCFPTSPQWVEGLGSNTQNDAMSRTKMSVDCPQSFHIGSLPNMSFLCIFVDFTQFLVKVVSLKIDSPFHPMSCVG